jgi:hypothetical protein
MEGAFMSGKTKRHRPLIGPPLDTHAKKLSERAMEAFMRAVELRRALDEADREFREAAREFRLYYNDAA